MLLKISCMCSFYYNKKTYFSSTSFTPINSSSICHFPHSHYSYSLLFKNTRATYTKQIPQQETKKSSPKLKIKNRITLPYLLVTTQHLLPTNIQKSYIQKAPPSHIKITTSIYTSPHTHNSISKPKYHFKMSQTHQKYLMANSVQYTSKNPLHTNSKYSSKTQTNKTKKISLLPLSQTPSHDKSFLTLPHYTSNMNTLNQNKTKRTSQKRHILLPQQHPCSQILQLCNYILITTIQHEQQKYYNHMTQKISNTLDALTYQPQQTTKTQTQLIKPQTYDHPTLYQSLLNPTSYIFSDNYTTCSKYRKLNIISYFKRNQLHGNKGSIPKTDQNQRTLQKHHSQFSHASIQHKCQNIAASCNVTIKYIILVFCPPNPNPTKQNIEQNLLST